MPGRPPRLESARSLPVAAGPAFRRLNSGGGHWSLGVAMTALFASPLFRLNRCPTRIATVVALIAATLPDGIASSPDSSCGEKPGAGHAEAPKPELRKAGFIFY